MLLLLVAKTSQKELDIVDFNKFLIFIGHFVYSAYKHMIKFRDLINFSIVNTRIVILLNTV
jgi:hypothetical protein